MPYVPLTLQMTWEQQQRVEADAPSHVTLPTGSRVPIEYGSRSQPTARARLQVRPGREPRQRVRLRAPRRNRRVPAVRLASPWALG
jgi:hypothetical protein